MRNEDLINELKKGKMIKFGHYAAGYETISWSSEDGSLMVKREDMGRDYCNPDVTVFKIDETELLQYVKGLEDSDMPWI